MANKLVYMDMSERHRGMLQKQYNDRVVVTQSFRQALEALRGNPDISLVVTESFDVDRTMLIEDFVGEARKSRADYLPIVVYTGENSNQGIAKLDALPLDALVSKSMSPDNLFSVVSQLLGNPEAYREQPVRVLIPLAKTGGKPK